MSGLPLRKTHLTVLVVAWVFAVIMASVGLNALVKSNQQKAAIKSKVPPPTVLSINTSDILNTGIVATSVAAFTAVLISKFAILMVMPSTRAFSLRTLRIQGLILLFLSAWLLACSIPYTYFYNTREAVVRAFIGEVELPHAIIKNLEQKMGANGVYNQQWYLKLLLGCMWPGWFFITVAAFTLLFASRKTPAAPAVVSSHTHPETLEKDSEKGSVAHNEKASV